jgi:hypothetical protein
MILKYLLIPKIQKNPLHHFVQKIQKIQKIPHFRLILMYRRFPMFQKNLRIQKNQLLHFVQKNQKNRLLQKFQRYLN